MNITSLILYNMERTKMRLDKIDTSVACKVLEKEINRLLPIRGNLELRGEGTKAWKAEQKIFALINARKLLKYGEF